MTPLRVRVAAAIAFVALCALLFELACRVYASFVVYPQLDVIREQVRHFYRESENPDFGYELKPDIDLDVEGRRLHINRYGIREDSDELFRNRRKIALLGDSVTFGLNHTQEETLSGRLQSRLDPSVERIKVLNFSVPGYGLAELDEFLHLKNEIYAVDYVIYLLNLNDYSRRNSIYEGADNGTYRIYRRPAILTPYFLRKAVYRIMRGRQFASARWYRWMYQGNKERGRAILRDMADYLEERGARFSVFILPSGVSYENDSYLLSDIHAEITSYLDSIGVPWISPVDELSTDVDRFFSNTDHFLPPGNAFVTDILEEFIHRNWPDLARFAGDPAGHGAFVRDPDEATLDSEARPETASGSRRDRPGRS